MFDYLLVLLFPKFRLFNNKLYELFFHKSGLVVQHEKFIVSIFFFREFINVFILYYAGSVGCFVLFTDIFNLRLH